MRHSLSDGNRQIGQRKVRRGDAVYETNVNAGRVAARSGP